MFDLKAFTLESLRRMKEQGTRANFSRGHVADGCAYRTAEGNKCLIGIMIPDDRYDPKMDNAIEFGQGGTAIMNNQLVADVITDLYGEPTRIEWSQLSMLQSCHDRARNFDQMVKNVEELPWLL